MMKHMSALISGLLFGMGLAISEMINPNKVLAFLDVAGAWDPSLLLVMASALIVAGVGFKMVSFREKPVLTDNFDLSSNKRIDLKLVIGAAIFGVGWGLAGYCPGPAVTSLVLGFWEPVIFILFMLFGSYSYSILFLR